MVFKGPVSPEVRAFIKYHGKDFKKYNRKSSNLVKWLAKKCKITSRTVYRILKEPIVQERAQVKGTLAGRKRILSDRTEKRMIRTITKMRDMNRNWIVRDLLKWCDINNISERTGQRILNRHGYAFLHSRRKGIVSESDTKKRMAFAKRFCHSVPSFWQEGVAFYFDGVGFVHKTRPFEDASACNGKVWRKNSEGLHIACTSKGSKAGYGGRQAKFFVAISYDKGVILAEQYTHLNGSSFAAFVGQYFEEAFRRSGKTHRCCLQDGDPSQNSKKALTALKKAKFDLFPIPPRSPELNPIENVFAIVKKELRTQAILGRIEREGFDQFSLRVKATLYSISKIRINNIIESYGKRLNELIKTKGGKIEY